ncbi:MAG TPA: lysine transporter LysE [Pseudomonas sp.]|nr:lysine transporter LysE [Pseudomonas sp.]
MGTLWSSYLNGLAVTAGLIVAIGAQNAFVLAQSLRREHHLPVAALCIFCDAVLVSLGVFGLAALLAESPTLLSVTRWGGVAFLLWYGLQALLRALRPQALQQGDEPRPRSLRAVLLAALAVTLLNPHVYLDTMVLIGSLAAQHSLPLVFALGAASASILWFTLLALGSARLAPVLHRPITWRCIDLAVAAMMLAIAWSLAKPALQTLWEG